MFGGSQTPLGKPFSSEYWEKVLKGYVNNHKTLLFNVIQGKLQHEDLCLTQSLEVSCLLCQEFAPQIEVQSPSLSIKISTSILVANYLIVFT